MTRREILQHFIELGFSIFPVIKNNKKPLVSWFKYQQERMSLDDLLSYGDCNIALVTGKLSGVDVIDLDEYKKAFPKSTISLDTPLIATTPHGGRHGYFKHKIGNRSFANGELAIDMKSEGGYVLITPSMIDGKRYQFNCRPTKEILASLPEIPQEILKAITPKNSQMNGERFDMSQAIGTPDGDRNSVMKSAVTSILNRYQQSEWDTRAWDEVVALNNTFRPPLQIQGSDGLQYLFNHVKSFVLRNPKTTNNRQIENKEYTPSSIEEDNELAIKQLIEGKTKGYQTGYKAFDEITGGLIPGETYLIFADTDVGKSVFTASILLFIAKTLGISCLYFDLENAYIKTSARLAMLNEDQLTKEEWRHHVDNGQAEKLAPYIRKLNNVPIKTWDLVKMQNRFSTITYEAVEKCMLEGIAEGRKVFVVDHLHYFEPSEKDFNKLGDIAKKLNDFAGIHNVVILIVAHTKKGLKQVKNDEVVVRRPIVDDINGSVFISKHTKNIIGMSRNTVASSDFDKQETKIYIDKTKNGETGFFSLMFNPHTLHFKGERSEIVKPHEPVNENKDSVDEEINLIQDEETVGTEVESF